MIKRVVLATFLVLAFVVPSSAQQLQVWTGGNTIWWSTPAGYCCGGATLGPEFLGGAQCSVTSNCSTVGGRTGQFSCNRPDTYIVTGCWYNTGGTNRVCEQATITVTEPPPLSCPLFELYSPAGNVLTHKYQATDTYPQGQTADAQAEVTLKPVRLVTDTTMYLRVIDPPSSASYGNPVPGDNRDTAAGTISTSPTFGAAKEIAFTIPPSGNVKLYLNTTNYAGGDNYVVEASPDPAIHDDPNFVCGTATNCKKTNPFTAYKRVYLEKKRMFRSGANIVGVALAGATQVTVEFPHGASGVPFSRNETVQFMHAPPLDGSDFRVFHAELKVIDNIANVQGNKRRRVLTLTQPLQFQYRQDPSALYTVDDGLGDGVGRINGGFYELNSSYYGNEFLKAFVEYRNVQSQYHSEIPNQPQLVRPLHLANKWFENSSASASGARPGDPNVKHVLAGSGLPDGTGIQVATLGQTDAPSIYPATPFSDANNSWTFVRAIEQAVNTQGPVHTMNPWIVNGENVVHELAHTWGVNYTTSFGSIGHCQRTMTTGALSCTMNTAGANRGDGIVGLHWTSDTDSEYMTIRWKDDPIPVP